MASSAEELRSDLAELKKMISSASRPKVKKELQRLMAETEELLEKENAQAAGSSSAAAPAATSAAAGYPSSAASTAKVEKPVASTNVQVKAAGPWKEITTFALELGGYDSAAVTVDIRMKGVEALAADAVTCDFTESSFDLKVMGFEGANHRMIKTNLEKDIDPAASSVRVKKNHVIVSLAKVKGQFGYDSWTDLCAKGKRKPTVGKADSGNPSDSIMDMMKDLYDDGDDNMKKVIGEAMFKAKTGQKYEPSKDDVKAAAGGLDDI
eukprot:TRINITY_DN66260_c0_g1_i1.p1 TRINITY_DN66260_c0_g1~~TRINITY_DN66260_c0_g1_i1.p1  ORF type:complete len:266 (+),score=106.83 TRINITY_DN66260_c0_g1_i1:76-873(+)